MRSRWLEQLREKVDCMRPTNHSRSEHVDKELRILLCENLFLLPVDDGANFVGTGGMHGPVSRKFTDFSSS